MTEEAKLVQHSTGRPFATWGCGYIAYNAARGAYRDGRLRSVIAPSFASSDIPDKLIHVVDSRRAEALRRRIPYRILVRFGLGYFIGDNAYDLGARKFIKPGGIFHGWSHQALFSMRRARKLACKLVLERPNSHPLDMRDLVAAERRKFGFPGRVDGPFELRKSVAELNEADRIVVCSEFARASHLAHGIPDSKIRVINYGVDTDVFAPGEKTDSTFRVVFCGMVCLRKGPQYLLEAWKSLKLTNSELWLIGMVLPDAAELMKEYADDPSIKIIGHVDSRPKLAELYRQASVFVFPSVEDGFGMVVTEAMACGVPVIISTNTGAVDVVKEGENGFIVPTYSVDALRERISRFHSNPSLSRDMSQAARRTALGNTWEHYSDKLARVYDELA